LFCSYIAESLPTEQLTAPNNPNSCKNEIIKLREWFSENHKTVEKKYNELNNLIDRISQLIVITKVQVCDGIYTGFFSPEPPSRKFEENFIELKKLELQKIIFIEKLKYENSLLAKRLYYALSLGCLEQVYSQIANEQQSLERIKTLYKLGLDLTELFSKFFPINQKRYLTMFLILSESKIKHNSKIVALHNCKIELLFDELYNGLLFT
jgi:hypothetical protein